MVQALRALLLLCLTCLPSGQAAVIRKWKVLSDGSVEIQSDSPEKRRNTQDVFVKENGSFEALNPGTGDGSVEPQSPSAQPLGENFEEQKQEQEQEQTGVSNFALPPACRSFFETTCDSCGLNASLIDSWAGMQGSFEMCCLCGSHSNGTCTGVAADLFKDSESLSLDDDFCEEMTDLSVTHFHWTRKHPPAPVSLIAERIVSRLADLASQVPTLANYYLGEHASLLALAGSSALAGSAHHAALLATIAAMAKSLSGCGGGGSPPSNGPVSDPDPVVPTPSLTPQGNPFVYSWTSWFSEEQGGLSEDRRLPITMVECSGDRCDNLRLLQGQHGESTQAGNAWTEWFSEENGGRQECSGGKVVTRIQCSGGRCDNKKLRCDSLRSGWTLSGKEWTNTWFSEEHGGQGGCYKPNQVVTGWKCNGGKCDNQQLQCAALTFSNKTPAAAGFDWTPWFGHGWSSGVPYGNFPIRGVQCHKGRCGTIRFYQGKWGADIEVSQLAHDTSWFSEEKANENENQGLCGKDFVVTRMECSGNNCDNKRLRCSKISQSNVMFDKLWESPWFSGEGDTVGLCPSDNHWLVGLRCRGRDCDDQQVLCRKIVPAAWNESPTSVGRWVIVDTLQYAGQDITTTVKRCVETESETVATREERNQFATETGVSLSIETKGYLLQQTNTLTLSFKATTLTEETVSNQIRNAKTSETCKELTIACTSGSTYQTETETGCWSVVHDMNLEAKVVNVWQWQISSATNDRGVSAFNFFGPTIVLPTDLDGERLYPWCPPTMTLGDDGTFRNCPNATVQ